MKKDDKVRYIAPDKDGWAVKDGLVIGNLYTVTNEIESSVIVKPSSKGFWIRKSSFEVVSALGLEGLYHKIVDL